MDGLDDAVQGGQGGQGGPPQAAGQHAPQADPVDAASPSAVVAGPGVARLESLCVDAYLKYLERECAAYVSLVQNRSKALKGEWEKHESMGPIAILSVLGE